MEQPRIELKYFLSSTLFENAKSDFPQIEGIEGDHDAGGVPGPAGTAQGSSGES